MGAYMCSLNTILQLYCECVSLIKTLPLRDTSINLISKLDKCIFLLDALLNWKACTILRSSGTKRLIFSCGNIVDPILSFHSQKSLQSDKIKEGYSNMQKYTELNTLN